MSENNIIDYEFRNILIFWINVFNKLYEDLNKMI